MIDPGVSDYRIEDNIPIPSELIRTKRDKYPWAAMNVGQSFLVPCHVSRLEKLMNSLTSCRAYAQKRLGYRFALRKNHLGIRVWRIE